jgi:xanthine dehydrogenase accessory factor
VSFDSAELTKLIAQHGRIARVVVVDVKGSAPREIGASMFVWHGGQSGTIGGGALEYEAAIRALDGTQVKRIPLGPNLGQCCGGSVVLVTEVFEKIETGTTYYSRNINGLSNKPLGIRRQEAAARRGEPIDFFYEDGWLFEPIQTDKSSLWIYGAGHVGRALVNVIAPLPEYDITWIDTAASRFPDVKPINTTQLVAAQPALTVRHAPSDASHLILTYSHALDLELCHQILSHNFGFAGLIGSKTKWARFRSRLKALGHSDTQISRITCPIGDPTFGKHPQEIAVGVASSLLSHQTALSTKKDRSI